MASDQDSKSTEGLHEVVIKDNITIMKIPELYVDELTEEQQKRLKELEKMFAYRYTDDDKDYVATKQNTTPPLVSSYNPFNNHRARDRSRGTKRSRVDFKDREPYSQNTKYRRYY